MFYTHTPAAAMQFIDAGSNAAIRIPQCDDIQNASFVRAGSDLLIITSTDHHITIRDYYTHPEPPVLVDANRTELTPMMVNSMASQLGGDPLDDAPFRFLNDSSSRTGHASAKKTAHDLQPELCVAWGDMTSIDCRFFEATALKFQLQRHASHGLLALNDMVLRPGDEISMEDIQQHGLVYYHDESQPGHDELCFACADGHEITIPLHILPHGHMAS